MQQPQLYEDLQALYDLLSPPDRWVKGFYWAETNPETHHLDWVTGDRTEAECFCLMGGILYITNGNVCRPHMNERGERVVTFLARFIQPDDPAGFEQGVVVSWNDYPGRTQGDVLAVVGKARDAAKLQDL